MWRKLCDEFTFRGRLPVTSQEQNLYSTDTSSPLTVVGPRAGDENVSIHTTGHSRKSRLGARRIRPHAGPAQAGPVYISWARHRIGSSAYSSSA